MPTGVYPRMPLIERFWKKVQCCSHGEICLACCWLWQGKRGKNGYGFIGDAAQPSKTRYVHRLSYEIAHGAIPEGQVICHHCDTPLCCNPSHLFMGSKADNVRDAASKRRMPHGESHHLTILTDTQVRYIKQQKGHIPQSALARLFGVARATIGHIHQGHTWKHIL